MCCKDIAPENVPVDHFCISQDDLVDFTMFCGIASGNENSLLSISARHKVPSIWKAFDTFSHHTAGHTICMYAVLVG